MHFFLKYIFFWFWRTACFFCLQYGQLFVCKIVWLQKKTNIKLSIINTSPCWNNSEPHLTPPFEVTAETIFCEPVSVLGQVETVTMMLCPQPLCLCLQDKLKAGISTKEQELKDYQYSMCNALNTINTICMWKGRDALCSLSSNAFPSPSVATLLFEQEIMDIPPFIF